VAPMGRGPRRGGDETDEQCLRASDSRRRRTDARRPRGVWLANWRRAGDRQCRHPLRCRRGYRVPNETHSLRPQGEHHRRATRPSGEYHRKRDAFRHGLPVQTAPRARCDGRRLERFPGHSAVARQGVVAAWHERKRQSFCRVRWVHGGRGAGTGARSGAGRVSCAPLAFGIARHGCAGVRLL
jgi:hypothetical protein